ncbi:MAG: 4-(cytidine 5'-diphospho)-2-C-methyl-D-erythritol kinase [Clostridia bacterium]|nr:4-(cytidine 5'-diphospho)-2-C-methyl-D-erythritol kinase [Clostridia bacterium]
MIRVKANAKINWSLHVTGRRPDGYHQLDMLMQSISLCDTLAFELSDSDMLFIDGHPVPWNDKNLVCRAASLLREHCPSAAHVRIDLTKNIPVQAGLGGGSADAAATLTVLNSLWNLGIDRKRLMQLGLKLGADVPFCLTGGLCRVRGIGETVEPLSNAPSPDLLLAMPDMGCDTAQVFRAFDETEEYGQPLDPRAIDDLQAGRWESFFGETRNDLTAPSMRLNPGIETALRELSRVGARFSRMSGSGACCFGLFTDQRIPRPTALSTINTYRVACRPLGVEWVSQTSDYQRSMS